MHSAPNNCCVFVPACSEEMGKSPVTVIFKLPYYTQWGQSLVIAGSAPALGSWNVKHGLSLSPVHQGNALVWCGQVSIAAGFTCEYSYHVVDDHKNVLRWEAGEKKKLVVPDGVQDGDVVEVRDWWQVPIATLMFSLNCLLACYILYKY